MKKALVFGGGGQAGSYLVELLESKGYQVSAPRRQALDFQDDGFWWRLDDRLRYNQPDELYNFAAKMFAPDSWKYPMAYMQVNSTAVFHILNSISKWSPKTKFFNAGSADVFDKRTYMQDEETERLVSSPYGLSKQTAESAVRIYRERGLYACTGILFNMESPRRKGSFFSQKVVREAIRIHKALETTSAHIEPMRLGKISALRDWGWAPDYVEASWLMLQQERPEDFVIGTGERHSCKEFIEEVFRVVGIKVQKIDQYVEYEDLDYAGPPDSMWANPTKIETKLGWRAKYKFKEVIRMLVEAELATTNHN